MSTDSQTTTSTPSHDEHAPRPRRLTGAAAGVRRPRRAAVSTKQADAARRYAAGELPADIARALGVHRSTIFGWMRQPWWSGAVEAESRRLAAEADAVARRARPEALRLLERVVRRAADDEGGADVGEAVRAAQTLLAASAPPSERARESARRELLGALPPDLRRRVAEVLAGADVEALRALSDEELDRLAGGES